MSDKNARLPKKRVRFARSASRHRISKERILHVIAHCGLVFEQPASLQSEVLDARLIFLGDDADGAALEVMAVEGRKSELLVIHAMEMRRRYQAQYEEAKRWRR